MTLPRAITYNLACTTLGLPAVTSDLAALDRRAAVLLDRHVPGYREIIASELPAFVQGVGRARLRRKLRGDGGPPLPSAAAAVWVDARVREELVAPTCLFAMLYLRYIAEDSDSWDETKEHESLTTREEELIRETSSGAFAALCAERPGNRWTVLQTLVDAEEAPPPAPRARARRSRRSASSSTCGSRAGCARSPTRSRASCAANGRRCASSAKDELTLRAIEQMIALEKPARQPRGVSKTAQDFGGAPGGKPSKSLSTAFCVISARSCGVSLEFTSREATPRQTSSFSFVSTRSTTSVPTGTS